MNQIDNVQIGKSDEWEADNLALTYLLNSNYNPGASAAMWQRVMDRSKTYKSSFVGEIFSPSDHPTHQQRRDNYAKRLTDLSGGNVTIDADKGMDKVGGKDFDRASCLWRYVRKGTLLFCHGQPRRCFPAINKTLRTLLLKAVPYIWAISPSWSP